MDDLVYKSESYFARRESLKVLYGLLETPAFEVFLVTFLSDIKNTQNIMRLLCDKQKGIQLESLHVFSVLVKEAHRSKELLGLLLNNKDKLIAYIGGMLPDRSKALGELRGGECCKREEANTESAARHLIDNNSSLPVILHTCLRLALLAVRVIEVRVDVDPLLVVQSLRADVAEVHIAPAQRTPAVHPVAPARLLNEVLAHWTPRELLLLDHGVEGLFIFLVLLLLLSSKLPLLFLLPQLLHELLA